MTTNTHVEHPVFIGSIERPEERRRNNWWTAFAIAGLAAALLAMAVQPSYPEIAPSGSDVAASLAE